MERESDVYEGAQLAGREQELGILRTCFEDCVRGKGSTLLIEGEAGIGKTRLLEEALVLAGDLGLQILKGIPSEIETERPFGPFVRALGVDRASADPIRARIARMIFPEASDIPEFSLGNVRFAVVEELLDLVESISTRGSLVLAVEDLHWSEESTHLTLSTLSRHIEHLPVSLIATYRPQPKTSALGKAVAHLIGQGATWVPLTPLGDQDVIEIFTSITTAAPGPRVLSMLRGASGNPLYIEELIGALGREGLLLINGAVADVKETFFPPSLALTVLRKLASLPESTLQFLRLASILGSRFSLQDLGLTAGRPVGELASNVEEAMAAGLIADGGDHLLFRHDLVRDAVYNDITPSIRKAMHLQAGDALQKAGRSAQEVAPHVAAGAPAGDLHAIETLRIAAHEVSELSPETSRRLYEAAIDLLRQGELKDPHLEIDYAVTLIKGGWIDEAHRAIEALDQATSDPRSRTLVRLTLARALREELKLPESAGVFENLLESAELSEPERAVVKVELAHVCAPLERPKAEALLKDWEERGSLGSARLHAMAASIRSYFALAEGRFTEAADLAIRALEFVVEGEKERIQEFFGDLWWLPRSSSSLALALADRLEEAEAAIRAAPPLRFGPAFRINREHIIIGLLRFVAGRWDEAVAEFETGLEAFDELNRREMYQPAAAVLSRILVRQGSLAQGRGMLVRASPPDTSSPGYEGWAWALVFEAGGQLEKAYDTLTGMWEALRGSDFLDLERLIAPDLLRLNLTMDATGVLREMAPRFEELAAMNSVATLTAASLHVRGVVEHDLEALAEAVTQYRRAGLRPAEFAGALESAAAAHAGADLRDDAVAYLEEARNLYEPMGASWDLRRVESALRALGVRKGSRARRRRPEMGPESLTPTEIQVAEHVAEGLTYGQIGSRLFISRRTVETHVSHIFQKLGISSRFELKEAMSSSLPQARYVAG